MLAGGTPNLASTPARRGSRPERRSTCTTRVPSTHCDRSLSGVQIRTKATRGSAAAIPAAAASASSASNSTIGHTATPSAVERGLERMELIPQRRVDAVAGLVAGPELVAERLDDVVGGDSDVGRALLEHAQHRADARRGRPRGRQPPAAMHPELSARRSAGRARRCRRPDRRPGRHRSARQQDQGSLMRAASPPVPDRSDAAPFIVARLGAMRSCRAWSGSILPLSRRGISIALLGIPEGSRDGGSPCRVHSLRQAHRGQSREDIRCVPKHPGPKHPGPKHPGLGHPRLVLARLRHGWGRRSSRSSFRLRASGATVRPRVERTSRPPRSPRRRPLPPLPLLPPLLPLPSRRFTLAPC